MSEPYLIQHKVRGHTAFDVAYKMNNSWVMHGQIVHAYWWRRLRDLCLVSNADQVNIVNLARRISLPDNWPDYAEVSESTGQNEQTATKGE